MKTIECQSGSKDQLIAYPDRYFVKVVKKKKKIHFIGLVVMKKTNNCIRVSRIGGPLIDRPKNYINNFSISL